MIFKKMSLVLVGFLLLLLNCIVAEKTDHPYTPTIIPDRIILNLTENPATSMAITWRTDQSVERGEVQWIKAEDGPNFEDRVQTQPAETEIYKNTYAKEPRFQAHYHSTILTKLAPQTKYLYRVGNSDAWSEWLQFETAAQVNNPFSFLYLGDAQNNIKSHWSRVIRQAFRQEPNTAFIFYAGDLINRSGSDREWDEWFESGSFIHAMIPSMMTPGNHEYTKLLQLDPHWRPQFTLPENGVPGLEETCYYIDYQNLRIISIDAEMLDERKKYEQAQAEWLEKILADNPQKWTILTLHFPFFSTKPSRDNVRLREAFRPIIEKYNVDVVLQGHDHAYGRGMKHIQSALDENQSTSTMYVVSVSGPKMYDISEHDWMTRRAGNTQLYQVINIDQDTLRFEAFTATSQLYDAFDLVKNSDGKNKLVDKAPTIPERLD